MAIRVKYSVKLLEVTPKRICRSSSVEEPLKGRRRAVQPSLSEANLQRRYSEPTLELQGVVCSLKHDAKYNLFGAVYE